MPLNPVNFDFDRLVIHAGAASISIALSESITCHTLTSDTHPWHLLSSNPNAQQLQVHTTVMDLLRIPDFVAIGLGSRWVLQVLVGSLMLYSCVHVL